MAESGRAVWALLVAAAFGATMHLIGAHATPPPNGRLSSVDIVNWSALWLVIPCLAGGLARTHAGAVLVGAGTSFVEVAVFYGDLAAGSQLVWLVAGTVGGGALGLVAFLTAGHRWGRQLVPALMLFEPVATALVFALLGRPLWGSWGRSAALEVSTGVVVATAVIVAARLSESSRGS